jgi:hypothetical protein
VFAQVHFGAKWLVALSIGVTCALSAGAQDQPQVDQKPATVTLSTPDSAATPDAPSALKFGNHNQLDQEKPISAGDKFHIFLATSVSSETFSEAAVNTQLMDDWKSGRFSTTPGYWTKYRTELATSESRALLTKYLLPVVLHQDPRYYRMEEGGVFHRGLYAASRVLFTRSDNGGTTINTSHLLGTLGSRTMANAYLPYHDRTWGHTLTSTGSELLSDMGRNLLREFGPDIKARFFGTRLGAKFAHFGQRIRTVGVKQEGLQ